MEFFFFAHAYIIIKSPVTPYPNNLYLRRYNGRQILHCKLYKSQPIAITIKIGADFAEGISSLLDFKQKTSKDEGKSVSFKHLRVY